MPKILTVRQRKILGILNSRKEAIRGREIADILGVTDRTVRTDIQILMEFLEEYDAVIEATRGKGYRLRCGSPMLLQQLVYRQNGLLSQNDRIREILWTLLDTTEMIPLGDLEDELYVSRSTLEQDLRWITFHYGKDQPHIRLIRKNNSIAFEEDEWKRRYILNLHYIADWNFNYEAGLQLAELPVPELELEAIDEILSRVQGSDGLPMSEFDHLCFVFSIAIAIRRIRQGFPIGVYPSSGTEKTMSAVRKILSLLKEKIEIPFGETEMYALSDELAHRLQYREELLSENYWVEHKSSVYAGVIREVLSHIDRELSLSLEQDTSLKSQLLYLLLTQYHNPYHSGIRDERMILHVRTVYPDALAMAVRFCEPVERASGMVLTENYLCEIAAYLITALEREYQKKAGSGIKVGVISHMTMGENEILLAQLGSVFGSQVILERPIPVYALTRDGLGDCDLALTTTRLPEMEKKVPVVTILHMLRPADVERLRFLIFMERFRKLYPGTKRRISELIRRWYVTPPLRAADRQEAMDRIGVEMERISGCASSWLSTVRMRDRWTSTALSEGFAFLHGWDFSAKENTLLWVKLEHPIDWGGVRVSHIFTFALAESDREEMMRVYTCLCYLIRRILSGKFLEKDLTEVELRELIYKMEWGG